MTAKHAPNHPKSRIPQFSTRQEAAEWWDAHDLADFQDEFTTVQARFAADLSGGITIPLDATALARLRTKAAAQGVDEATLARRWLLERLGEDEAPDRAKTDQSALAASAAASERQTRRCNSGSAT
jgi:hypothetical protein